MIVENISFRYAPAGPDVVRALNFTLGEGEIIGLVGANGSGKTTLVHLLHGSLTPTSGTILRVDGTPAQPAAALVGADPEMQIITTSVFDEVAFALRAARLPATAVITRTQTALAQAGLMEYASRHPGWLSRGEQLRVLVAAALARQPAYLLLDEVASMLDAHQWRSVMQQILHERAARQMTTLIITHRLEDLAEADRVMVLAAGELVFDGALASAREAIISTPQWAVEAPLLDRVCGHLTSPSARAFCQRDPVLVSVEARYHDL